MYYSRKDFGEFRMYIDKSLFAVFTFGRISAPNSSHHLLLYLFLSAARKIDRILKGLPGPGLVSPRKLITSGASLFDTPEIPHRTPF